MEILSSNYAICCIITGFAITINMKSKKCDTKRILHFSLNDNQNSTIKHFEDKVCKKRMVQHVLKHYVDIGEVEYLKNSGLQLPVLTGI